MEAHMVEKLPDLEARKSVEIITVNGRTIMMARTRIRCHYWNGSYLEILSSLTESDPDPDADWQFLTDILPDAASAKVYILWCHVRFYTYAYSGPAVPQMDHEFIVNEFAVSEPVDHTDTAGTNEYTHHMYFPIASFQTEGITSANPTALWRLAHVYHVGDIDCWPHMYWEAP